MLTISGRLRSLKSYKDQTKVTKTRYDGISCLKFYREQTKSTQTITWRFACLKFYVEQTKVTQTITWRFACLKFYVEQTKVTQTNWGLLTLIVNGCNPVIASISSLLRDKLWLMATFDTIQQIECPSK